MRWVLFVCGAIPLAACASRGPTTAAARCAPIVSDSLVSGVPVFPACGVSREAKLASAPLRPQYNAPRGVNCARATVRVVIDANGRPVPATAKVVQTTDRELSAAIIAALPSLRYEPAIRDGVPVAQLQNVTWQVGTTVMPAATRGAGRATRPRC